MYKYTEEELKELYTDIYDYYGIIPGEDWDWDPPEPEDRYDGYDYDINFH